MSALAGALSFDDSGYAAIEGAAALLEFRESRRGSAPSARRSTTLGQLTARPTRSRQCQAPADPAAAKTETKSNGSRQRNGVVLADSRNHRGRRERTMSSHVTKLQRQGGRIKQLRRHQRVSQEHVAQTVGVTLRAYQSWERGQCR